MHPHLNCVAILVAAVASFLFGWLWYGPLFGKAWAREMKMSMDQKPGSGVMIRGMILMIIGALLTSYVLASNASAWHGVMPDAMPAMFGFMGGFFTWLGFYVPQLFHGVSWEGKSWKLFWINAFHAFFALQIISMILAFWPMHQSG